MPASQCTGSLQEALLSPYLAISAFRSSTTFVPLQFSATETCTIVRTQVLCMQAPKRNKHMHASSEGPFKMYQAHTHRATGADSLSVNGCGEQLLGRTPSRPGRFRERTRLGNGDVGARSPVRFIRRGHSCHARELGG